MDRIRRSDFARSFLLPLALTFWLGACHKWVEVEPPQLALQEQADKPVRARQELRLHIEPDGQSFEGSLVSIAADSVVLGKGEGRITVSTADVTRVDVRRTDTAASVALGFGIILGFFLAVSSIGFATADWDFE